MGIEIFKPSIPRLLATSLVLTVVVGLSFTVGIDKLSPLSPLSYPPVVVGTQAITSPTPALGIRPRILKHPFWTPVIIFRNTPNSHLGLVVQDWVITFPYWLISSYLLASLLLSLAPQNKS